MLDTTLRQTLSGAWMHRKDDRHFSGNGIDCSQKLTLDTRMALHLMPEHRRGPPEAPKNRPAQALAHRELHISVPPIRHSREKSTTSMP